MRRVRFALGILLLVMMVSPTHSLVVIRNGGNWPENWPAEMEKWRSRAKTHEGLPEVTYSIEFIERDDFEELWPVLLKLKSPHGVIRLYSVDKHEPKGNEVLHRRAEVYLECPRLGSYELQPNGSYVHVGPWSADLSAIMNGEATAGNIPDRYPMHVAKDEKTGKWFPYDVFRKPDSPELGWRVERSRVDIVLYVDGHNIDLNRIKIPPGTLIEDRRVFEK
jgi:hypothetical protein